VARRSTKAHGQPPPTAGVWFKICAVTCPGIHTHTHIYMYIYVYIYNHLTHMKMELSSSTHTYIYIIHTRRDGRPIYNTPPRHTPAHSYAHTHIHTNTHTHTDELPCLLHSTFSCLWGREPKLAGGCGSGECHECNVLAGRCVCVCVCVWNCEVAEEHLKMCFFCHCFTHLLSCISIILTKNTHIHTHTHTHRSGQKTKESSPQRHRIACVTATKKKSYTHTHTHTHTGLA
jgi:hypothetical protein